MTYFNLIMLIALTLQLGEEFEKDDVTFVTFMLAVFFAVATAGQLGAGA